MTRLSTRLLVPFICGVALYSSIALGAENNDDVEWALARSEAMNDIVKSGAAKIAQQTGASLDFVTTRLKELISTGVIRLDFQIGIYLVVLGGAVAAAGSIVTLVRQRAAARTPPAAHTGWPAPAPWAGASGWSSPPSPRPDDGAGTSGTFTA